jgi:hypothetical protein
LVLRRLVPTAYRPVLANGVFRRLILDFVVSYLRRRAALGGSGLATVALGAVAGVLLLARRRNRSGIEKHPSPSRG